MLYNVKTYKADIYRAVQNVAVRNALAPAPQTKPTIRRDELARPNNRALQYAAFDAYHRFLNGEV